jgi:hypothetical protein
MEVLCYLSLIVSRLVSIYYLKLTYDCFTSFGSMNAVCGGQVSPLHWFENTFWLVTLTNINGQCANLEINLNEKGLIEQLVTILSLRQISVCL